MKKQNDLFLDFDLYLLMVLKFTVISDFSRSCTQLNFDIGSIIISVILGRFMRIRLNSKKGRSFDTITFEIIKLKL